MDGAFLTKQHFLDGLQMEVQKIEQVTKPLQEYMGIQVTKQLNLQQQAKNNLSIPLYTLYCEIEAYIKASESSNCLRLQIIDAVPFMIQDKNQKNQKNHKKRFFPACLQKKQTTTTTTKEELEEELVGERQQPSKKRIVSSRSLSTGRLPTTDTSTSTSTNATPPAPSRSPSIARVSGSSSINNSNNNNMGINDFSAEKVLALKPTLEIHQDQEEEDQEEEEEEEEGQEEELTKTKETIDLWQTSEKAIQLDIVLKSSTHYQIVFQYLPLLQVVTVQLKNHPVQVLMELFPLDDGLNFPNLSNHYKWQSQHQEEQEEMNFPSIEATKARPYYWAQWIAGLYDGMIRTNHSNTSNSKKNPPSLLPPRRPEPSIRNVMQQLLRRFVSYEDLQVQLKNLNEKKQFVLSSSIITSSVTKAASEKTKLFQWKETTKTRSRTTTCSSSTTTTTNYQATYEAIFQSPTNKKLYHVQVDIPLDYPICPSTCHFATTTTTTTTTTSSSSSSSDTDTNTNTDTDIGNSVVLLDPLLKEIEMEVNCFFEEFVPKEDINFLLSHQLYKIQTCLDLFISTSGEKTDKKQQHFSTPVLSFGRFRRGKDRRQAIVVDATTKELRHR
jgi:hypothetical protein